MSCCINKITPETQRVNLVTAPSLTTAISKRLTEIVETCAICSSSLIARHHSGARCFTPPKKVWFTINAPDKSIPKRVVDTWNNFKPSQAEPIAGITLSLKDGCIYAYH